MAAAPTVPLIQLTNLGKSYGGTHALADLTLDLYPGEVHGLMGENGAGKSTLIKCLSGAASRDSGTVHVDGKPLAAGDLAGAEAAGIAVIHQESVAFPHLSARDNIFVGREPRLWGGLVLDKRRMEAETRALLERLGESFATDRPVGELSLAQRQMVGMARAISKKCRLLIMDEPTASLSHRETQVLFRLVRQMRAEGVGVLYVSHRMDEIFELCDRVTVLRDGRKVETRPIGEVTRPELIRLMVGREVQELGRREKPEGDVAPAGEPVLEVRGLTRAGEFREINLRVHAGEILGLAGLVGAGRSEVAGAIFGITAPEGGQVLVSGEVLPPGDINAAMAAGIGLVPEDRQHQGLVLPLSVGDNLILTMIPRLSRGGIRRRGAERELIDRLMTELSVRAPRVEAPAITLSGGNQQKLVVGKWLATKPRLLILDEPTRGVDVGAKAEIYRLVRELAQTGMATLLISSDLPELLGLADRIAVMREGEISGELDGATATQEALLELALPVESGVAA